MRTKHLFYTAAMAALFAACVNDDFETISEGQNTANDGRPVVSDVKLKFTAGADTRLAFGEKGYAWEADDEIGALLMDNVKSLDEKQSWLQRYELIPEIHTSYRFYYDSENEEWKADAKMLEGNYFFAYPWEDYDGHRQVAHSLINQEQNGIKDNVVAESYADNQFFIGYSQIMAGTGVNEVLDSSVEMVPLLGAIQLRITNTGTQTYHINKVVLSNHKDLASVMTFNPTDAKYNKWNLVKQDELPWISTNKYFNYANYTGNESDSYTSTDVDELVYNIEKNDKYNRIEALRRVAKGVKDAEKSAQLVINGTEEERALLPDAENTAYVLIMSNPLTEVVEANETKDENPNSLFLSIYTDEGFVQNIDLGKIYNKSTENMVVTDSKITKVGPNVSNTIKIQIDDNSFVQPDDMDIYNSSDLMQFIEWNVAVAGARDAKAELKQNVTFTAEMLAKLESNKNTVLTIGGAGMELTLAEDVPATVLSHKQLKIAKDVKVIAEGALTLNKNAKVVNNIEVAEGATMKINGEFAAANNVTITNKGTLEIVDKVTVANKVTFENEGKMTIGADADVKGEITNKVNATIDNEGYIAKLTNNKATNDKDEDGVVNMIGKSTIAAGTNNGIINAGKESRIGGTNNGEIVMTELGAKITAKGTISYVTGDLDLDDTTLKALSEAGVNKLILTGDVTVANEKEAASFTTIAAQNGSSLEVGEKASLTVIDLKIEGDATTDGVINTTNVTVDEDVVLTNFGTIKATKGVFKNYGKINNHGTVSYETNVENVEGEFGYNKPNTTNPEDTSKQDTMNETVGLWANKYWDVWTGQTLTDYYGYTPYDVDKFIETLLVWNQTGTGDYNKAADALAKAWGVTTNDKASWEKALKTTDGKSAVAAFNTAVNEVLNAQADAAGKVLLTEGKWNTALTVTVSTVAHEDQAAAQKALYTAIAQKKTEFGKYVTAAYIWTEANSTEKTYWNAFTTANPYTYVWQEDSCPLYKVMKVVNKLSAAEWDAALEGLTGWDKLTNKLTKLDSLMTLLKAAMNEKNPSKTAQNLLDVIPDDYMDWKYTQEQFSAIKAALDAE